MAKQSAVILTEFILDRLPGEPLAKRAQLYRALGDVASTPAERKIFNALAAECDEIERRHQQLALDFKRGAL